MVKEGDIGLLKIKHRNEKLGGSKSNKGFYSSLYDTLCETRVIWASYLVVTMTILLCAFAVGMIEGKLKQHPLLASYQ